MKATYNGVNLHDIGDVTIVSRQATYSPPDLPQERSNTLSIRIDVWQRTWTENNDLIEQVIAAIKTQAGPLKMQSEDRTIDVNGTPTVVPGEVWLDRQVTIGSHTLPDDPNSWGTYQQSITIVFNYSETDLADDHHLKITFTKTRAAPQPGVDLGNVTSWKEDFRVQRFDEMKTLRKRHSGMVTASGTIMADTTKNDTANADNLVARRQDLISKVNALRSEMDGQTGTLLYSQPGNTVFNKVVKVDALSVQVNQAVTGIDWTMTFSYTQFPDEDSFAAAEFSVQTADNRETGESEFTFQGQITANSETAAVTKLNAVRTAVLAARGFNAVDLIEDNNTTRLVNADDSDGSDVFLILQFDEKYRRRMNDVVSWTLKIDDSDDVDRGYRTRRFSGTVTASGATADAAYSTALSKAKDLGDNKHPFRVNGTIGQTRRQVGEDGAVHFVSLDFGFTYRVKGKRIYIEMTTDDRTPPFGDVTKRVSGFVQAKNETDARDAYNSQIRPLLTSYHIQDESTRYAEAKTQQGSYGDTPGSFTGVNAYHTLDGRLDFDMAVYIDRADSDFTFQYGLEISSDYGANVKTSRISGTLFGSPTVMSAAASHSAGNKVDDLLTRLGYDVSKKTTDSRTAQKQDVGTTQKIVGCQFNVSFREKLNIQAQVLQTTISETIEYAGDRWNAGQVPDGFPVMQHTGYKDGRREVSGSVVATTEAAAINFVNLVLSTFPFPGTVPSTRYLDPPRITRSFEFDPFIQGIARGAGANFNVVRLEFSRSETLQSLTY